MWRREIEEPTVGKEQEYQGRLMTHCRNLSVRVLTRHRFWIFDEFESLFPIFRRNCGGSLRHYELDSINWSEPEGINGELYDMNFIGIVSEPEICGYKGSCTRSVVVVKILECWPISSD